MTEPIEAAPARATNVWFPLRSNVAYFETTAPRLDLAARVKEIALLTDELWFEDGTLTVTVDPTMVMPTYRPPPVDLEDVRRREQVAVIGSSTELSVTVERPPGAAPQREIHQLGGGPLQRGFVAQYRRLFEESGLGSTSWAHLRTLPPEDVRVVKDFAREVTSKDHLDREAPHLSDNEQLDAALKGDLNLDLVTASRMGMAVAIDELHLPMLDYKAQRDATPDAPRPPGSDVLKVWIPDFTHVPWRDVIALHDHDAIGAFRSKLVEAEEEALHVDAAERPKVIAQIGIRESARDMHRYLPTLHGFVFSVGLDLVIGLTPLAPVSAAVTAVREIAQLQRARGEWIAVHLALQHSADTHGPT
jgi:hypothetical protein